MCASDLPFTKKWNEVDFLLKNKFSTITFKRKLEHAHLHAHRHIYGRIFCRDPNELETLKAPLFASNRLVLLRDMNFCISMLEKKTGRDIFHIKVLLSEELSVPKKRLCYKISIMTVVSQGLSEPSYFLSFH